MPSLAATAVESQTSFEAILEILIGFYFKKAPQFHFQLEFEAQNRSIILQRQDQQASVMVDGERLYLKYFAQKLHKGSAQDFYPKLTLVYYSGSAAVFSS